MGERKRETSERTKEISRDSQGKDGSEGGREKCIYMYVYLYACCARVYACVCMHRIVMSGRVQRGHTDQSRFRER